MSTADEDELIRLAHELQSNDKAAVKAITEQKFDEDFCALALTHFRIKRKIRSLLARSPVIQLEEGQAKKLILNVSQGSQFVLDKFVRWAAERSGSSLDIAGLDELDSSEVLQLATGWFESRLDPEEYTRNLYEVGSLLLSYHIPENLKVYITELRECYAFQQYNAVIALCRTVLEATALDICQRKGLVDTGDRVVPTTTCPSCGRLKENAFNPNSFSHLIKNCAVGKLKTRASNIYYKACKVVHGERAVGSEEALRVLRDTVGIVQDLYSSARL